jgi:NADPH:quinone reductase-like Zn-dependent oxidoreductase
MKAILFHDYGPPNVLTCEEAEKPAPRDSEVLLKVRAASVNPLDWHGMRGKPYVMRLTGGLRKPKRPRLGVDVAGQVEAIGKNVAQFRPGDEVFGGCLGLWAFAEYACAPASQLVPKPANLTFEQAASVPVAGFTALQALRDKGQVQPGQKVLINGAAGGVGTFAVQIAKWLGADVTGVCSTRNVELVRFLGADRVIDYTQENFTKGAQRYELILDAVGNHPLSALRRAVTTKGICVIAAGPDGLWLGPLSRFVEALALSPFVSQKLVPFIANPNRDDLTILRDLIASGKIKPVIDRCYKLTEVPAAVRYLEGGHARGKVIITV